MALNTQRYNYKGHDIYVFMSGSSKTSDNYLLHRDDSPYSYAVMVDGQVLGNVDPDMWFMKDDATFTLDDGVQLRLDASARIFTEKVALYADGVKLEPEERHNRSFENMRRLSDGFQVLGHLTDAQFLAIKSLSAPVVYSYALNQADITRLSNTAMIKELHSDALLQKSNGELAVPASLYLAQPGDQLEMLVGEGSESRPFGVHYDGYETYAKSTSIDVKDIYLPSGDRGFNDWVAGSFLPREFTIDGVITLHPSGVPMYGCITSVNYLEALEELEQALSQMPEDQRVPYENALKELINEHTTLAEFATIRELVSQGYELTDVLLMEIASRDKEWQEALIPRYFDSPEIGTEQINDEIAHDIG